MLSSAIRKVAAHSAVSAAARHSIPVASTARSPARYLSTATLNVNKSLKKDEEDEYFGELVKQPVTILQGIGPKHAEELDTLGLKTVEKLAGYKFYHLARSLVILSKVEEENGRSENSKMNVNKGLDKAYEGLPLVEIVNAPVHALQGITEAKAALWASLGVKTIADLSQCKYCQWAEAFQIASRFEERE